MISLPAFRRRSQTQLIPTGLAIQLPGAHLAAFL